MVFFHVVFEFFQRLERRAAASIDETVDDLDAIADIAVETSDSVDEVADVTQAFADDIDDIASDIITAINQSNDPDELLGSGG